MRNADKIVSRIKINPVMVLRKIAKPWARRCLGTTPAGEAKGQTVPLNPHPKETSSVISFVGLVRPRLVNTA